MKKHMVKFILVSFLGCLFLYSWTNPASAKEKPKYGGTLTFNYAGRVSHLGNPLKFRGPDHGYIDSTLQTLLRPSNDKMGEYEPWLAESWELARDKSYYIIHLRKGIKFHDGTDFNAKAVKWNLDRWINSPRPELDKVSSVDIIDAYTIRLNLKSWESIILDNLAKDTYIISPTAFKKNGEKWADTHPVGTGPFKFKKYKRDRFVEFEKFDNYWKKGLPYLDGLKFTMIPDPMIISASLKRQETDAAIVDYVMANEFEKRSQFQLAVLPGGHSILYFNSEDPSSIWYKTKCRQALEYAIDKEALAKNVTRGFGFPVYEIIHSVNTIQPGPGTVARKYNPEKAKALFKESGVSRGTKVKLTYAIDGPGGASNDYIAIMQQLLKNVGLTVELNGLNFGAFLAKEANPPLANEILISFQRGGPNELLISANTTLGAGSVFFKGIKKPDGFLKLLDQALQAENKKKQVEYLFRAERLAYENAMFVPIFSEAFITAQHPYVKGAVWYWGKRPYSDLEKAWIDPDIK